MVKKEDKNPIESLQGNYHQLNSRVKKLEIELITARNHLELAYLCMKNGYEFPRLQGPYNMKHGSNDDLIISHICANCRKKIEKTEEIYCLSMSKFQFSERGNIDTINVRLFFHYDCLSMWMIGFPNGNEYFGL